MASKYDFYITYHCNANCKFCCVRDKLKWFVSSRMNAGQPFENVKDTLIRKRRDGYSYVTFTGGEPTSHPDFLKIMALAKKLGYRTSLNSNMTFLADEDFSCAVIPFIDEIVASIHGHNAQTQNDLMGIPNGFERFLQGMENLERAKKDVYLITDTVILSENIDHLTEIIELVSPFKKLRQMLFSNVNLPPDSIETFKYLVAPLPEIRKVLPLLYDEVVTKRGLALCYYGLPFCALGQYNVHSADLYFENKDVIERTLKPTGVEDIETNVKKPTQAKVYSPKCKQCIYLGVCGGYFRSYNEIFGDIHIEPVIKKIIP